MLKISLLPSKKLSRRQLQINRIRRLTERSGIRGSCRNYVGWLNFVLLLDVAELGMKKIAGKEIIVTAAIPKKMMEKPSAILSWYICRIKEITAILMAEPHWRNMPRIPVIVETRSGMSSMQALLAAGRVMPVPKPERKMIKINMDTLVILILKMFSAAGSMPISNMLVPKKMEPRSIGFL
jgi:hypothetical protein